METILHKSDVVGYFNIPDIPKKVFDGKTSFKQGVAVVKLAQERLAYAACTFDSEKDTEPRVTKAFSQEPFYGIEKVYVVPSFMDTDVSKMDLDDASKKAAEKLAQEVREMEDNGVESEEMKIMKSLSEWVFDEIHNREEADAWLRHYNKRNRIRGKLPKDDESMKLRLLSIWSEKNKK